MKSKNQSEHTSSAAQGSRRRFAKAVAAALVAAPLAGAVASSDGSGGSSAQTTPQAKAPPNPQTTPTPTPTPQRPSPVAEAYGEVARARFGAQTTTEEFARIRRDLEGNVRTAERLRAFKLKNGDEPDFAFEA